MSSLFSSDRGRTWLLAAAILSVGVSVAVGRLHGDVADFVAGFFLGISIALAFSWFVIGRDGGEKA